MRIIVKEKGEVLFDTEEDTYLFDLDQMKSFDWYEESVRLILDGWLDLDGPSIARFLYLLSYKFLVSNEERLELTSEDLR
jgi:hypothetical protein